MLVRLSDQETGELFAECPLPGDGTPLTTAVEPVLDSSRYFVLRVVDRGTGKHAFIGLGFRERSDASGFTTGLDEYRKYLLRKAEAERMRQEHEEKEAARAAGGAAGGDGDGAPARDHLALKQNITIQLKAVGSRKAAEGQQPRGSGGAGNGEADGDAAATAAAAAGVAALKLAPPPAAGAGAGGGLGVGSIGTVSSGGGGGGNASDDEWGEFTG